MMRKIVWMSAFSAFSIACSGGETSNNGDEVCTGKCDGNADWIKENLGERTDPIAQFLREGSDVDEEGIMTGDLQDIQLGLSEVMECDVSEAINFVISDQLIVGAAFDPFPRLVSTVCENDDDKRWRIFLSPPDFTEDDDIDIHTVEMFAWDEASKQFNFYKTHNLNDGDSVEMEVGPAECAGCHLGPNGLDTSHMPMLPVMNELTQPWEHWNAKPGFESQLFSVPDDIDAKENYEELASDRWLASASILESTIRRANKVVADERVKLRRKKAPGSVTETMSLLRPIFCDEQINYISEAGDSGQLLLNGVVDLSLRDLLAKVGASPSSGKKWRDLFARLRMEAPTGEIVSMMPVRGEANILYELSLVSAPRGLEETHAIQVRVLDWMTPTMSDFRCRLWMDANNRLAKTPLEVDLETTRNFSLIPILMEEIMTIDGVSLLRPEEEGVQQYYMLNNPEALDALVEAIGNEEVPAAACADGVCECRGSDFCLATADEVAEVIEEYVLELEGSVDDDGNPNIRERLLEVRQERVCLAKACYPNAPFIENSSECTATCPLDAFSGQ